MKKQIEKIDESLKKITDWIGKTINWEYKNNKLILQLLHKKERLLENTKKKLIRLNMNTFIEFEETQNTIIS